MQLKVLKYLLDIESVIQEIEAIRKIVEEEPNIQISSAKNIIGLRNIISHAYDAVEPEMIWGIIQNNVPILADEIKRLK